MADAEGEVVVESALSVREAAVGDTVMFGCMTAERRPTKDRRTTRLEEEELQGA